MPHTIGRNGPQEADYDDFMLNDLLLDVTVKGKSMVKRPKANARVGPKSTTDVKVHQIC